MDAGRYGFVKLQYYRPPQGFEDAIPQIAHIHEGKSVFLINVILDELAHIKTGKDHGNKEYDTTLEKYYKAYYKKSDLF